VLGAAAAAGFAVLVVVHGQPFLHALQQALHANWQMVAGAVLFEAASVGGYILVFHRVVAGASSRLTLKDSYDITLAGTTATRLLPTAGLGGAAVSVWALRARGVRTRELTERLLAFLVLLYAVYMATLVASGAVVALGLVHVGNGRALGVIGAAIGLAVGGVAALPSATDRLLGRLGRGDGRLAVLARRAAGHTPVLRAALRRAASELRQAHPALLGALAWWGFDVCVLATMLHAFGASLPFGAVVFAYFLGTMFNVLPLPGSLSGGLVGVTIALGAPAAPAVAGVLAYRTIAVWLPAASGIVALVRLRTSVNRWRSEAATGAAR
jgi:uncharacterized membrane protein YbhN (UPF0104 family)